MLPPFVNIVPIGDENRSRAVAWVTLGIIIANVAVFLSVTVASPDYDAVVMHYGLVPAEARPITWLTHLFLHDRGVLHILFNMLFLWSVAHKLEETLKAPGFLGLYLVGGLAAAGTHVLFYRGSSTPVIGASGAVAAVMGAYIVLFPRNRIKIGYLIWVVVYTRMGVWRVRAKWWLGAWFLLDVFLGLAALGMGHPGAVARWAHVGGFVFGATTAMWLRVAGVVKPPPAVVRALKQERVPPPPGVRPDHLEMVRRIEQAVREGRAGEALPAYETLLRSRTPAAPSPPAIWGVAEAFERGRFIAQAAAAFERIVALAPADPVAPEAALRAGLMYARTLGNPAKARFYLRRAADTHRDPARAAVARDMLRLVKLSQSPGVRR